VLHWIAVGKNKEDIAEHLGVTTSCVKRHCENASLKLGANNMASAVARAMSYGLITI
jgi:DNA-binding NarL/FixJ family response regulator